jgi:DNA invertase Pin-like site-specific DNA recombinase
MTMTAKGQAVAYLRISHRDQSLDSQRAKIQEYGKIDKWFEETASTKKSRAELDKALDYIREGDTFVVTRADRIARNTAELLATVQKLKDKGATIHFVGQPELNGEGKYGSFLLAVLGAVAELERDMLDEKRKDGIAAARAKGKKFGRPRVVTDALEAEARQLKAEGHGAPEIARRLNLGVSTTYRLLADAQAA